MKIETSRTNDTLTLFLSGRLDGTHAPELESAIAQSMEDLPQLVIHCADLEYVSSAGLRVLLTTFKKLGSSRMRLTEVPRDVFDILDMTGFSEMIPIERKLRNVDTTGCECIGKGMDGTCWRLNDETLLKLYAPHVTPEQIEREKARARAAFVLGIPTALSYDMVRCGNQLGVVFEMVHAHTLAAEMAAHSDDLDHYAALFADLSKTIHRTVADATIPRYLDHVLAEEAQATWMTSAERAALHSCIESFPSASTCLHGDYHPGNVLYQNGELLFIDMAEFSQGHPYFDIAQVYNIFVRDYASDLGKHITRLERPERHRFWRAFLKSYFDATTPADIAKIETDIARFNCVRQLTYIRVFAETAEENKTYVRQVLANLPPS